MKYRKALLDKEVNRNHKRDGGSYPREIRNRNRGAGNGFRSYTSAVRRASEDIDWQNCTDIQKHNGKGNYQEETIDKKESWGGEFWTDGYYAATVGERANWTTVEKYIQRQRKPREELKQLRLL